MQTKAQMYAQMSDSMTTQITGNLNDWLGFLKTSSRMYKYPYYDQLMIYAQRPDATACAEYDFWKKRMNRYVKQGSKGIALVDNSGQYPKLHYVFDISDTETFDNPKRVNIWQMKPEHNEAVKEHLAKIFEVSAENNSFIDQLEDIITNLTHEYWTEHEQSLLDIIDKSFLMEYDEFGIEQSFLKTVSSSVAYAIFNRCVENPNDYFNHDDFTNLVDFNTHETANMLTMAVSELSFKVFHEIELAVKNYDRMVERSKEYGYQTELQTSRGLSASGHSTIGHEQRTTGQVRDNASNIFTGTQSTIVQQPSDVGEVISAFERNRPDSQEPIRTADETAIGEISSTGQGNPSDGMGGTHEQPESSSGRNNNGRTDLQLNFFDLEQEKAKIIDNIFDFTQKSDSKAENLVSSAFSFAQKDIDSILRIGGNTENLREIVISAFEKQKPNIEQILKSLYHGGNGIITDNGKIAVWYAEDGIHLSRTNSARYDKSAQVIPWKTIAERIGELLESGNYATNVEVIESENAERTRLAEKLWYLYHDLSDDISKTEVLSSISGINLSNFPSETQELAEKLKDSDFRSTLTAEYEQFLSAYKQNRDILRFHYHKTDDILSAIKDLDLPRKKFKTDISEIEDIKQFITDDEIDTALSIGSGFENGKNRIYDFFIQNHDTKEKAEFLKDEYGTGGHSHALSDCVGSMENHDYKGIKYQKSNCDDINLTWENIAKRIDSLISRGIYKEKSEIKTSEQDVQAETEPFIEVPEEDISVLTLETQPEQIQVEEQPNFNAENFHITDFHLGEGGAKQKYANNISAINKLFELEQQNRFATPEEQEILSKYVGWGGLADAFDENKANWKQEYKELKELLSEREYEMARASTLNAHYTSPTVIKAIYDILDNMGFEKGNILEPSCGIGNFFGLLPEKMSNSKLYGVELDDITGRIAKQLYPKADITITGFETTDRKDFYDLAIGNVPFGNYKVIDKPYDKLGFSIHNYFFAKTLDQVRSGGIIAFITSRYTMDSKDSSVRRYIAQRAELLGAIRLPNNAFKANAGTEVVSDIIFLQKRDRPIDIEPDWTQTAQTEDGFIINSYFIDNPQMILGINEQQSTAHGMDYTVNPIEGAELAEQLKQIVIDGSYKPLEVSQNDEQTVDEVVPADPSVKNFSFANIDGEVYFRENSVMRHLDLNETAKERIKGMIALRQTVGELMAYQLEDWSDEQIKAKQAELESIYDKFTAQYGLINSRANAKAFDEDSSYYLLCSLENVDENGNLKSKADMFYKRTIRPEHKICNVDTPSEALTVSIGERGRVDLPYMAQLLKNDDIDGIVQELRGIIFRIPNSTDYVTADEYLSGNVREKLVQAKKALESDEEYSINVEALEKAQPKDLDASEIDVRLGATWIDHRYIQDFMHQTFETPYYLRRNIEVKFSPLTAEWQITGKSSVNYNDVAAYTTYGTERANAYRILEETLNLKDIRIYDTVEDADGKQKRVFNKKETTLAQQKQQAIKDAFAEWIWKEPKRREILVKQYNKLFNSTRPREYDGSHIVFGGMNPEIALREHQKNAIAHILYGGNTLLAHEVGAGKTFEMAASAMESKRLGLCQKSMFVVPNHLTLQWANEFLRLYPSAKLLVANKRDFETANRKKFCARIATGDYDAVIIGHSQFEKIPISAQRQERILRQQIDEIEIALSELKHNRGENFSIKQMEKTRKSLQTRLDKLLANDRKDDVVTFEQLGVDRLFVDESHAFKNLFLYTKMRNVAGLSTSEAQKSSDMFMKCQYMDELTGGRGVIFATGTPVSNSMTELYTVMRYLQYNTLQQQRLTHFDCWASTFGETTTAIELAPEGTGYRARTRFAKFFNLPELMNMFKEVADIKTADQLNLPVPEAKFETILVKPSEHQKAIVAELSERAAQVHSGVIDPSVDNMLKITSDGRKLGLDQRLINPLLPDNPQSKLNVCVDNVFRIWEEGKQDKLTQLLFCDLSTPKNDGTFNVYDDIKTKLISNGVPEKEIAFIHDADSEAKKKELFAKVRAGKVRILLGSTQKLGAGTNIQDKLIALHHLDVGWRPSDMTQRNGRIIRQGNKNKQVQVYQYVTEGTFDAYLYQTLENKQKFISQIMTSKSPVRSCDDVDEQALSYAEIKALCAGNPLIKEKMDLDIEVARLKVLKADYQSQQYSLEDKLLKYFPVEIEKQKYCIKGFETDIKTLEQYPQIKDGFIGMTIADNHYSEKEQAGSAILEMCKNIKNNEPVMLGNYRGFQMELLFESFNKEFQISLKGVMSYNVNLGTDARGNITRLDNALDGINKKLETTKQQLENLENQQENAKIELGKPFIYEAELAEKNARLVELDIALNIDEHKNNDKDIDCEKRPSVLADLKSKSEKILPAKPSKEQEQVL